MNKSKPESRKDSLGETKELPLGFSIDTLGEDTNLNIIDLNENFFNLIFRQQIIDLSERGIIDAQKKFFIYLIEHRDIDKAEVVILQECDTYVIYHSIDFDDLE